jgi:subtilase family protein
VPGIDSEQFQNRSPDAIGALLPKLREVRPDAMLGKLCALVAEILARSDGRRRSAEATWSAADWWPWLVEDLTARRFILIIDNLDLLATLEQAVLQKLVPCWLAPHLATLAAAPTQADRELADFLEDFIERVRELQLGGTPNSQGPNPLFEELPAFRTMLQSATMGRIAAGALIAGAQRVLEQLQRDGETSATVIAEVQAAAGSEEERRQHLSDLDGIRQIRRMLDRALRAIAERRSVCRIAVVAAQIPEGLLEIPPAWRFEMRLGHLTWAETWRWVHRNLPGLLQYGETYLARLWSRMGPDLSRWEELERRAVTAASPPDLSRIVNEIAPRSQAKADEWRTIRGQARGERPLRVAVAGPHLAGPEELAAAFTRLAGDHLIGGRVVPGANETGSLALVSDVTTPFVDGRATESTILEWLDRISEEHADIILLDYGSVIVPGVTSVAHESPQRHALRSLRHRALLIAAGGNVEPKTRAAVSFLPAAYPEVLAVGAVDATGRPRPYTAWTPAANKPELFMDDNLMGTPLEEAVQPQHFIDSDSYGPGSHGSSFAALHAVAAAVLVWSTLPYLSPRGVRDMLIHATEQAPVAGGRHGNAAPPTLTVAGALKHARKQLVIETLAAGPCSAQALAAITGLDLRAVVDTVNSLLGEDVPRVRRLSRSRLERYELATP